MNEDVKRAGEHADRLVSREARSAAEKLMHKTGDAFWKEFSSYRPSNLHSIDPLPLDGGVVHGGGSRSKRHKKPAKTMAEYLKTWGT